MLDEKQITMEYLSDKIKRIVTDMVDAAIKNGEPNFSISVSGDKSTIESEHGQIVSQRANIKSVSLFINLEDVEDE